MKHSDTLAAIAPALVKALGKLEGAAKTKANPGFKGTKYADLETVINSSRDTLTEHGLTIIQLPGACASGVMNLETIIMHESGEWISGEMGIALGKTDPQGVGSALTYARRYAQMAALNMAAVDDDGEAAMGRGGHAQPAETKREELKPEGPSMAVQAARLAIDMCGSQPELAGWLKEHNEMLGRLNDEDYAAVGKIIAAKKAELKAGVKASPRSAAEEFGIADEIPQFA